MHSLMIKNAFDSETIFLVVILSPDHWNPQVQGRRSEYDQNYVGRNQK